MSSTVVSDFKPTPASIPPPNASYRLKQPSHLPPHIHPLNPLAFVLRGALIRPDKIALVHSDAKNPVVYTYSVWAQRIQNFAYALIRAGIQPGDRVAVIAPNTPLIAEAHHAVLAARAVVTPINTRLTPPEVAYILSHSQAKLILVDSEYLRLLQEAAKSNESEGIKSHLVRVVVSYDTGRAGDPYEEFLDEGRNFSGEKGWGGLEMEGNEDAPATLCYTSGTTGRPKGVLSTLRGSYLAAVANAFEARIVDTSVYLWILPMFHAAGWTFPWAVTFAFATQITMRTVDNTQIWDLLLHGGVTHYCGAPTVQIGIVNHPDARRLPRPVSAIIAGSAPTAHLIGDLEKKNIHAVHVYGLTETYGPFTRGYPQDSWKSLSLDERAKLMARQGHAFATAQDVRVVRHRDEHHDGDDDNEQGEELIDVPADGKTMGEIITRGNIVMKEYFRDEEATKKAFKGGWFHSGDLAVMNPDGSISIQDRSKDIIISGGENASSLAIEQELAAHPAVQEVAVVARPHHKWGERPLAYVILHTHAAAEWAGRHVHFGEELKRFARTRLPGFACPEWVTVVDELPKTSTGKIVKHHLRREAAKL